MVQAEAQAVALAAVGAVVASATVARVEMQARAVLGEAQARVAPAEARAQAEETAAPEVARVVVATPADPAATQDRAAGQSGPAAVRAAARFGNGGSIGNRRQLCFGRFLGHGWLQRHGWQFWFERRGQRPRGGPWPGGRRWRLHLHGELRFANRSAAQSQLYQLPRQHEPNRRYQSQHLLQREIQCQRRQQRYPKRNHAAWRLALRGQQATLPVVGQRGRTQ